MTTDPLQSVLDCLESVKPNGDGNYLARCPAHPDKTPSLSVGIGEDGKVVLYCFAGCDSQAVLKAIGKEYSDLFPDNSQHRYTKPKPRIARNYDYTDETGTLLFQVCRTLDRRFMQRRPDGDGGWMYNLNGVRRVLYRLPELLTASAESFIYDVEGEKDADRLADYGLFTTTNSGGAGKWKHTDDTPLHSRHVVILPDNDKPGHDHAEDVAKRLHGKAKSVRIVELPDLPDKGDVSDWLDAGHDPEDLDRLAAAAALWEPGSNGCSANASPSDAKPATETEAEPAERLNIVCMADVEPERIEWLWPYRFPIGKFSILAGMQGLGKSIITTDMAARISTGKPWPDEPDVAITTGSTIILTLEDGLGDTLRPRLDAAGADSRKVHAIKSVGKADDSGIRTFNVVQDIERLEEAIKRFGKVRLVVVDPLTGYLGDRVNINFDNEVRAALTPLGDLAERTGVAVLGVMHVRKSQSEQAMFRVIGSVAFTAYARACWMLGEAQDDPGNLLMLKVKLNIALAAPGLKLRIVSPGLAEWSTDPVHLTAQEVFTDTTGQDQGGAAPKLTFAMDFLEKVLADGPQAAKAVKEQARENCISSPTLDRAKAELGVIATQPTSIGSAWFWELPGQ